MPPSSRKRNKGKDRKAKQLAKKEEKERAVAHEYWQSWATCEECDHGCGVMIPAEDHPVYSFMDQFFFNLHHNGMKVIENLKDTLEKQSQVWSNENHRNIAINTFVRVGTNCLLRNYGIFSIL